jgi:hypothetical protein
MTTAHPLVPPRALTPDDRLIEQLARRIRGPLRSAGAAGLPFAQVQAAGGYGWAVEQLARALWLVDALPARFEAGERWRVAEFDPDAPLSVEDRAVILADARARGLAVRPDGAILRAGAHRIEHADDYWLFLLADLEAVAA